MGRAAECSLQAQARVEELLANVRVLLALKQRRELVVRLPQISKRPLMPAVQRAVSVAEVFRAVEQLERPGIGVGGNAGLDISKGRHRDE
jgi:hypothetical protein